MFFDMKYVTTIFRDRYIIKFIIIIIAYNLFMFIIKSDVLISHRLFYLIDIPIILPVLVSESNKYLFIPELITRSNQPSRYYIIAQMRRFYFLLIASICYSGSSFAVSVASQDTPIRVSRFVFSIIVLFIVGFLLSALIDIILIFTKKHYVCIVLTLIILAFDYALAEGSGTSILFSCISSIRYYPTETPLINVLFNLFLIILVLTAIIITIIYQLNKSDYYNHPREA